MKVDFVARVSKVSHGKAGRGSDVPTILPARNPPEYIIYIIYQYPHRAPKMSTSNSRFGGWDSYFVCWIFSDQRGLVAMRPPPQWRPKIKQFWTCVVTLVLEVENHHFFAVQFHETAKTWGRKVVGSWKKFWGGTTNSKRWSMGKRVVFRFQPVESILSQKWWKYSPPSSQSGAVANPLHFDLAGYPFFGWHVAILAAQCLHSYWLTSDLGLIIIYC